MKTSIKILILLAVITLITLCFCSQSKNDALDKATSSLEERECKLSSLKPVMKTSLNLIRQKKIDEACNTMTVALNDEGKKYPNKEVLEAMYLMATITYMYKKDYKLAKDYYLQIIKSPHFYSMENKFQWLIYQGCALAMVRDKYYGSAINYFLLASETVKVPHLLFETYHNLARIYVFTSQFKKAIMCLEQAIRHATMLKSFNKKMRKLNKDKILKPLLKMKDFNKVVNYYRKHKKNRR